MTTLVELASHHSFDVILKDMKSLIGTIHGKGIEMLPEAILKRLPEAKLRNEGDVAIILSEKYYARTNSNLLTVIIFRPTSHQECNVSVITGGGGCGSFDITWGSETSRNNDVVSILNEICSDRKWEILDG